MSTLSFTANKTALEGKQGKLPTNKDGHKLVLCGAYNIPNNIGEVYPYTSRVEKLFSNSTMIRKLNNSQLYGEADHPSLNEFISKTRTQQEAVALWVSRLTQVPASQIAHQWHGFDVKPLNQKIGGRQVMGVFGWVNPFHEVQKASLSDPNSNTAYSVRSFVDRTLKLGEVMCEQKDLITYDWVPTGGIPIANKYCTPGLESEQKFVVMCESGTIDRQVLEYMDALEHNEIGNESERLITTSMIKNLHGAWQEVPDLTHLISRRW